MAQFKLDVISCRNGNSASSFSSNDIFTLHSILGKAKRRPGLDCRFSAGHAFKYTLPVPVLVASSLLIDMNMPLNTQAIPYQIELDEKNKVQWVYFKKQEDAVWIRLVFMYVDNWYITDVIILKLT